MFIFMSSQCLSSFLFLDVNDNDDDDYGGGGGADMSGTKYISVGAWHNSFVVAFAKKKKYDVSHPEGKQCHFNTCILNRQAKNPLKLEWKPIGWEHWNSLNKQQTNTKRKTMPFTVLMCAWAKLSY